MSYSCFLCLFLFVTTFSFSTISATHNDLIDETCKQCEDQSMILSSDLCSSSLGAIPVSHAANLQGLALIAMELTLENATTTISTIEKLILNDVDPSTTMANCLRDCLELYSDATWSIMSSIRGFLSENYVSAVTWMISAMEAASTCHGGFEEKDEVSPLINENSNLFQLCGISLCIIQLSTPTTS